MGQRIEQEVAMQENEEDGISDLALVGLDLLMDNPAISSWINQAASHELKRECRGEDDEDWYSAVAQAYGRLIDDMKKANSLEVIKEAIH